MAQHAAYASIKTAIKILQEGKPERLYQILTEDKDGLRSRKVIDEDRFKRLKATTRKAWSLRSLRWLQKMTETLRSSDVTQKSTKTALKDWVKHHVPVRGDRILWGRPLVGEMRRRGRTNGGGGDEGPDTQGSQDERETPQMERRLQLEGAVGEIGTEEETDGGAGHGMREARDINWSGWRKLVGGTIDQHRNQEKTSGERRVCQTTKITGNITVERTCWRVEDLEQSGVGRVRTGVG